MSSAERKAINPIHLCIGSPRSGTTWLFNNLKGAPQLFLPVIKEVGYWYGGPSPAQKEAAIAAILSSGKLEARQSEWLDRWRTATEISGPGYLDLMAQPDQATLDISPSYCIMPPERIRMTYEALPASSKVIYFVRNPYERILSQFKLHAYMHGNFRGPASDGTLSDAIQAYPQRDWQDYTQIVENWQNVFGTRFKVYYYDDLMENSERFFDDIVSFLGLHNEGAELSKSMVNLYFGTDRNQEQKSIFPSFSPAHKAIVARYSLQYATDFAKVNPPVSRKWISEIRQRIPEEGSLSEIVREDDPMYQRLLRMTESLGDNCEFGFVQRGENYEPSSLFRWAMAPAESILSYLSKPVELFVKENLAVRASELVYDTSSGFYFHSELMVRDGAEWRFLSDQQAFDALYESEKKKIDFLKRRFWEFLRYKPAVFVIKANDGLDQSVVQAISTLLRSYHRDHVLLSVAAADEYYLEKKADGLYVGSVSKFADYATANLIEAESWRRLLQGLLAFPEINALVNRMFV